MKLGVYINYNKLWMLRYRMKFTQRFLADLIGVSQSSVSYWERGLKFPSPYAFKRLLEVLEVEESYLTS
jgi:transcriptional regulator with XRE-family HTH domain